MGFLGIRAFVVVIFDPPQGNKLSWLSSYSLLWSHSLSLSSPYVSNYFYSSTSFPDYLFLPLLILRRQRWHINRYPSSSSQSCYCKIMVGYSHPKLSASLSTSSGEGTSLSLIFLPFLITSVIASPPIEQYPHGNITDGIDWVETEPQQVLQ